MGRKRRRRYRDREAIDRGLRKTAALVGYPLPRTVTVLHGASRRPAWWRLALVLAVVAAAGWWGL